MTEYDEAILVFFLLAVCVFCLPETYAPVLLKQKAKHLRKSTGDQRYWNPHEGEKFEINTVMAKHLSWPLK